MAKTLLTALFLFIWLLLAAAALGRIELFPQLTQNPELWFQLGPLRINMMYSFWFLLAVLFYFWINTSPAYVVSPQERWRNDEYFRQKVRDLEIDYKNKSGELRTRTVLLALLGYGVVWGSIALMATIGVGLGITAAALLTKIGNAAAVVGLIPIGFALKLSKALLGGRGGDSGMRLSASDAPTLFALLEKIRKKGKGPPFERVFINMEMNASVSRHTGLRGFFGFGPVTLTLGLPLMQALTGGQLAAVIGHEYGHVAAKDNALGQWIYRIRNGWLYLDESMKTEYLWYVLRLNRFYHWFMGIFNAYSFTLSRQCEYEADAFAAKISGAKQIAAALTAMETRSEHMRKNFWDDIWKKSELLPEPAGTPYQRLGGFFKLPQEDKINLAELKKAATNYDSTHPALADRVAALHESIHAPEPLTLSAAAKFLGERFEVQLAALFDRAWREHNRAAWKARYKEYQSALATLDALKNRKPSGMARDELSQLIAAAQVLQDDKRILSACQEILKREPDNTGAKAYMLGLRLVLDNDESALLKLDDLVRVHPEHMPTACRFALRYLNGQERKEEAKVYQFRLDEWGYQNRAAEEERRMIYDSDVFLPHNVTPEYVRKLAAILKKHPEIGSAWMARKQVHYLKENPVFVVGLTPNIWSLKNRKTTIRQIKRALELVHFPPYFQFFWIGEVKGLELRLKKTGSAAIYKR
ncbi:MAG: M48 family metalloprotease [Alphaproteobacteria bacterium]|nr:M48 family metalloprotease [Alphaproteobacteria bacterium]